MFFDKKKCLIVSKLNETIGNYYNILTKSSEYYNIIEKKLLEQIINSYKMDNL